MTLGARATMSTCAAGRGYLACALRLLLEIDHLHLPDVKGLVHVKLVLARDELEVAFQEKSAKQVYDALLSLLL